MSEPTVINDWYRENQYHYFHAIIVPKRRIKLHFLLQRL